MPRSAPAEFARDADRHLPESTLSIYDLKSYGATVALRDLSLSVRRGEAHALVDENGAGKSIVVKIEHRNGGHGQRLGQWRMSVVRV